MVTILRKKDGTVTRRDKVEIAEPSETKMILSRQAAKKEQKYQRRQVQLGKQEEPFNAIRIVR